jgi:hypothetical protein
VSFTADSGTFNGGDTCALNASGQCSVSYTATALGPRTITARYFGDTAHTTSNGSTSVTVITRSTTTSVSCSPNQVTLNVATTCTATVTDSAGAGATTPTGTVSFSGSGLFLLGSSCTLSGGRCSVTYTPTLLGTSTVTGSYGGDAIHAKSGGNTTVTAVLNLFGDN